MVFKTGRKYAITWCKKAENYSSVRALKCYDEAIKRDPEFAEPWYGKGKIFRYSQTWMWDDEISPYIAGMAKPRRYEKFTGPIANNYVETLKCFDKATELDPKFVNAWFAKGNFYWKHDDDGKAINCLDEAIALDSKFEPAWFVKAQVLDFLGRLEEALKCYDKATALLPTDAKEKRYDEHGRYYFFDRWYGKAYLLSELGRHEEALKCYDKALEICPLRAELLERPLSKKGITLAKLGRHEEALKCYDEAIALLPRENDYRRSKLDPVEMDLAKADALSELGKQYEKMLKCYSDAISRCAKELVDGKMEGDLWKEGVKKLQEICSQAINGSKKYDSKIIDE